MKKIMIFCLALCSLIAQSFSAFHEPTGEQLVVDVNTAVNYQLTTVAPCFPLGGWSGNGGGQWNRYKMDSISPGILIYRVGVAGPMGPNSKIWEGDTLQVVGGPSAAIASINYDINRSTAQGGNTPIGGDNPQLNRAVTVRVNAPPVIPLLPNQNMSVGQTLPVPLGITDPGDPNPTQINAVSSNPGIVQVLGVVGGSVSLKANNAGNATINISASDTRLVANGAISVNVAAPPPNEPPSLEMDVPFTVVRGQTNVIATANLELVDSDNSPDELFYFITALPTNGILKINGVAMETAFDFDIGDAGYFWQTNINEGLVTYAHDGSTTSNSDRFEFWIYQFPPHYLAGPFNFAISVLDEVPGEIIGGNPNSVTDAILTNGLEWITNGMPGVKELIAQKGLGYFKGNYQGLSSSEPWVQDTAGFFNLKLKKNGKGKVIHKKVSEKLRWKGDFDSNGVWFKQYGNDWVALALTTNKQIYGYITNTADIRPPSAIVANIAYYDAKNNPWPGQRNFLVKVGNTNTFGQGLLTINKAGVAKLNLGLNDNSQVIHKARIAQNGTWPLFKSLFKKQGSIQSFVSIKNGKSETNTVSGKVYLQESLGLQSAELLSQ